MKHPALTPKLRFPEFRENWKAVAVSDFFDLTDKAVKAETFEKDKLLTVRLHANGVVKNEKTTLTGGANYFKRNAGQFIFSKIDLLNGAFGVVPGELDGFASSSDVPAFSFNTRQSPSFFLNWLKSSYQRLDLERTGTSSTLKRVSPELFLAVEISAPTKAEQQKIAECLSALDELMAAESQKLDALKAHKKGLMQQLFPREGETLPRLRFPEFLDAPQWEEKKLEELATRGSGHTPNKAHPEYYNGGIKWVSLADSRRLDNGLISETEIEISKEGIDNSSACLHPAGTVLISRDAGVGKSAVMATPMAVSQHFIVWTCDRERLSNWFLYHLLQKLKPVFERVATGSTIKTIGLPFFEDLVVTIPSLPEQHRIASCLSSLDDLIAAQSDQLEALKTHKKGLMQQLFPSPAETGA